VHREQRKSNNGGRHHDDCEGREGREEERGCVSDVRELTQCYLYSYLYNPRVQVIQESVEGNGWQMRERGGGGSPRGG
jgi:hypothetical protein